VFEADFLECSYGFRPGRSPHHALRALRVQIVTKKVRYIAEADIRGYLDHGSYCPLIHETVPNRLG
jgi:RNA-directed DNA polymerase